MNTKRTATKHGINWIWGARGGCFLLVLLMGCENQQHEKGAAQSVQSDGKSTRLVSNQASAYSIYYATNAPSSVKTGAEELQRVIRISTGVNLPIVNTPAAPMICLGDNAESRKAGFSAEKIPDEGFRIVTKDGNIYIVGKDWPDKDKKWVGCDSTGTLYGIYDFLERFLGARWLMPGKWGEDIPRHAEGLKIPEIDMTDSPAVASRSLAVGGYHPREKLCNPDVWAWVRRNRIGRSIFPICGENFYEHPSTEVLKAHPEFMPLRKDGTREKPVGNRAGRGSVTGQEHKLCMSNPDLIQAFAESLMASIAKDPKTQFVSANPADGGLWCVCPECQKYKLTDTNGIWGAFPPDGYSMTPLTQHFFNGVARIVGQKYPDHIVGGYAYAQYFYPPYEPVKMEPNTYMQIALTAAYGFKLYKPERAALVQRLITEWAKIAPQLGWYDYSTWMRNAFGAPLPPGLPIMKTIFPAFGKSLKNIDYHGQAWGYGAAHNYLVAKLMWNNEADVDALYREYLERAYGPAAASIDRMYAKVEEYLKKYIIETPGPDHEVWYDTAVKVYAPIYDQIEQLYVQAMAQAETEAQCKRLEMLGDNLVMFNWNMRHAGLIKNQEKSVLYRSDVDYEKFLAARTNSITIENLAAYAKTHWQTVLWAPENRVLEIAAIPAGAAAPKVDGDLSDEAWQTAAKAEEFRANYDRRGPAKKQTVARVTYDATNLYVAFECVEEEPAKIQQACEIRNSQSLFADDHVALLIQPPGGKVLEFKVNARGNIVCREAEVMYPSTVQAAALVGDKKWTVEMAIPFKELGSSGPPAGTGWRGNFGRNRVGSGMEKSTWCRVEEDLADPRACGELRFPAK